MNESLPDGADDGPAEVDYLRRRIRALEAGRRALLDALSEGAAEVDAEGRIVACNQRFAEWFGRARADLPGASLVELTAARPLSPLDFRPLPPPAEGTLVVVRPGPEATKQDRTRETPKQESLGALAGGWKLMPRLVQ